ncbi:uncharacterized protein LY89DRAFT_689834 [Mollisia scopiformis]|uniref:Flavin-containing monooxygenase n=1 Tax=Mollisia scopiformis TaxID=149040 RepID=A0A132BD71_MOLSC|nr:uncharacterized protein LY89DRAFT_689834 [Mollisia scopiformis]KUJ09939.1 hypothetical protein LY89DRAFT_689834 [Mollisia scopiformis]
MPPELDWDFWEAAYPGSIIHSGDFRDAQDFEDKKVVIIGGGPSYFDIAKRISPYVKGDILISTKKRLPMLSSPNQRNVSSPMQLLLEERGVAFVNDEREHNIDIILLCTGYEYEYPFIPKLKVSKDGKSLLDVWKQMFWIQDPTLAFVGLPKMSAIFTVVEAQSAYVARALSGRITIPSKPGMQNELKQERKASQPAEGVVVNGFHDFNYPKDKKYINQLFKASSKADKEGRVGKQPPRFDAGW